MVGGGDGQGRVGSGERVEERREVMNERGKKHEKDECGEGVTLGACFGPF